MALSLGKKLQTQADWVIFMHGLVDNLPCKLIKLLILYYIFSTGSFESCLIATVNQAGDADTTGTLAGMLAGARYGVQQIPDRWLKQLDPAVAVNIRRQTTELIQLAQSL